MDKEDYYKDRFLSNYEEFEPEPYVNINCTNSCRGIHCSNCSFDE